VRGAPARGLADVGARFRERLPGQPVHQVEVHVVEGGLRHLDRAARLVRRMDAPERGSFASLKLWMPSESRFTPASRGSRESARFRGAGVGLHRYFGAGLEHDAGAQRREERSIDSGENRLGVPPPMNTLDTRRPQTSGSSVRGPR
jgi:hypothetical protein